MLPRSEELQSKTEAINWILNKFRSEILKSDLGGANLCLIAHHFIPSVASAWARAEPGGRIVRVESLWGIPEGLYWFSHDTFEIDTLKLEASASLPQSPFGYRPRRRLRYKGTFIAPDKDGKWIPHQTAAPYDWGSSIRWKKWLFEIALTTRQVADKEKYPISLMWFVGNHYQATGHRVLPWFHNRSDLLSTPKAAPRRKRMSSSDFTIKNATDWHLLSQYVESKKHIERVVVEPTDIELIRNPQFTQELAQLAVSNKFVVELAGGILSHVYYQLRRQGVQVECTDLFGIDQDVIDYNKIVRDKIPSLIEARGEHVETVQLSGDALVTALRQKLVEEAFEALDAKPGDDLISELADVEEIVTALAKSLQITMNQVRAARSRKRAKRGAFDRGLMLVKTATPHSIQNRRVTAEPASLLVNVQEPTPPIITTATALPTKPLYRRPDLRQLEQQLEKLFTFATEINRIGNVKATLNFSMPLGDQREQAFSLTIELHRSHSSLRGTVRLRAELSQLPIDFPSPQLDLKFPD